MLIRREAFEQVGGFDERFFLFWEDADLCWRLRDRGWSVWYCTRARVMHRVGQSVRTNLPRSIVEFHRSAYRWYIKHRAPSLWNPMRWIAATGLSLRAMLHLLLGRM